MLPIRVNMVIVAKVMNCAPCINVSIQDHSQPAPDVKDKPDYVQPPTADSKLKGIPLHYNLSQCTVSLHVIPYS